MECMVVLNKNKHKQLDHPFNVKTWSLLRKTVGFQINSDTFLKIRNKLEFILEIPLYDCGWYLILKQMENEFKDHEET